MVRVGRGGSMVGRGWFPPQWECTVLAAVCDGTQNSKRYRYRFSGTKYFRYRYQYFFQYQIFPRLFSDTKFYRYRFRDFFPIPNFTDTGSETLSGTKFFRYGFWYHKKFPVLVPIINLVISYFFCKKNQGYSSDTFSGTKFFDLCKLVCFSQNPIENKRKTG